MLPPSWTVSVLFLITAVVASPTGLGLGRRSSSSSPDLEAATDRLLFDYSLPQFTKARADQEVPGLDYSSDGCTAVSDDPLGFDFGPSCARHDFGYRNYKAQGRFSDDAKSRIDKHFLDDMDWFCNNEEDGVVPRKACKIAAKAYYEAVVLFGRKRKE